MKQIQASEAKARFLQLLDEVERGQSLIITRHGLPVARLSPEAERQKAMIGDAIRAIRNIQQKTKPMKVHEILAARDEGRKR